MESVTSPEGTYNLPPDGKLPLKCPGCGMSLEHFKRDYSAAPPAWAQVMQNAPFEKQGVAAKPVPTPQPVAGNLPEAGDIYVPGAPAMVEVPANMSTVRPPMVKAAPAPAAVPFNASHEDKFAALDNPLVGGKVTIFALLYGEFIHLHKRCLTSILRSVPPDRMDLRVACNQVCLETKNFIRNLPITKVYADSRNRRKYTAMREMFHDSACPITTKWLIWFDDDSYVRSADWLPMLANAVIAEGADSPVGMYGQKMYHPLRAAGAKDPRKWFHNAPWWRGRNFRDKRGNDVPNGNCIHFITGGFWALSTAAMRDCAIPCARLNHNGGDVCIGEQIHQGGYRLKLFNDEKRLIHTSNHKRRGYHEKFQWM